MTKVVNVRNEPCDVYIGRPSIFGNPFLIGIHGSRRDVIAKYREYFLVRVTNDPEFREALKALKGMKLGCYCKPLSCHGDVIAEFLDEETP